MRHRIPLPHIGLRTVKTTAAIIISMMLVYFYGTTDSRYIFAMLGAMAAMEHTFSESLEACLTQFLGVLFGAILSLLLLLLPIHSVLQCAIGILLSITLYNALRIRFSPSLPCMLIVIMCTTPDIQPIPYAISRFWDTAIGLFVGMLINTLVFPYDNSRRIRESVESLDKEVIRFLEEMFDGDRVLPDPMIMARKIDELEQQLRIFNKQKLFLHRRRQDADRKQFLICKSNARELLAQMEVLGHMDHLGRLNEENRRKLTAAGADIRDKRRLDNPTERDIVTNYHVSQILTLRKQLLEALKK